jgi:hypothetical protein
MVSFADLRDAEPKVFTTQATRWAQLATQVDDRGKDLNIQLTALADWEGKTADAASGAIGGYRKQLMDISDHIGKIPGVLNRAATDIGKAKQDLQAALADAARSHLTVDGNGAVSIPPRPTPTPGPAPGVPAPGDPLAAEKAAAQRVGAAIQAAVRAATIADEQAAGELRKLTAQATGFGGANAATAAAGVTIPKRGTKPADVKKWWDSLTPAQKEALLFTRGAELGALDGIPVEVRDRANRARLAEDKSRLEQERDRLTAKGNSLSEAERGRLDQLNKTLRGVGAIENRLNTAPSSAHQPAYLMGFDPNGNGRGIVAIGNPDTAKNVVTYVPGTGSQLSKIGSDLPRADKMVGSATAAGSPSTAAITWVGYDAPQSITEASDEKYAQNARGSLDRFQDGLRATHEGPRSHNTVIGHSYGSTTVGHTARDMGLNADDVISVGSPGVGVEHARDLKLDGVPPDQVPNHVHSSRAEHDMIGVTNVPIGGVPQLGGGGIIGEYDPLGPDPTGKDFGGKTFTSNPGTEGPWYTGGLSGDAHSQYWDPNSKSLRNIGLIVAGKPAS